MENKYTGLKLILENKFTLCLVTKLYGIEFKLRLENKIYSMPSHKIIRNRQDVLKKMDILMKIYCREYFEPL